MTGITRKTPLLFLSLAPALLAGCAVDVLPVHPYRVKAAQRARDPGDRMPSSTQRAQAGFTKVWSFKGTGGFRYDPARVEISAGAAKIKRRGLASAGIGAGLSVIETSSGRPYAALENFTETVGPGHRAVVRYQLSNDGSKWFRHDRKRWSPASAHAAQGNTAKEVAQSIAAFPEDAGPGILYVRAFLEGPGDAATTVELMGFEVTGLAPEHDSAD